MSFEPNRHAMLGQPSISDLDQRAKMGTKTVFRYGTVCWIAWSDHSRCTRDGAMLFLPLAGFFDFIGFHGLGVEDHRLIDQTIRIVGFGSDAGWTTG